MKQSPRTRSDGTIAHGRPARDPQPLRLPSAERQLRGASASQRDIYDYIFGLKIAANRQKRGPWVQPRQDTIAKATGYCRRTVGRAIAELKRRGLLLIDPRFYRTCAGAIRRASNRCFLFVATNVFAIWRSRQAAATSRKRSSIADRDISVPERAPTQAHKLKKVCPPSGQTAFLRAHTPKSSSETPETK